MSRDPSLSVVTGYQSIQSMVARPIAGAVARQSLFWAVNFQGNHRRGVNSDAAGCSRTRHIPGPCHSPYQARVTLPYQTHTRPVSSSPYQPYQARCSILQVRTSFLPIPGPYLPLHTRPVPLMCVCVVSAVLNVRRSGARNPEFLNYVVHRRERRKQVD